MNVKCIAGDPVSLSVSDDYQLDFGVPQVSCLGPLLFSLYCNDLNLNLTLCNTILFADDTTLHKIHKNLVYLKWCIQDELYNLMDWFKANILTLNLNKTVCVLFDEKGRQQNFEIEVEGIKITTATCTKFLGIWIDNKLRWDQHVNK